MATVAQQLAALTDQVAALTEEVRVLAAREVAGSVFFEAGREHERAAMLGKAHNTETARTARPRPGHLRSV